MLAITYPHLTHVYIFIYICVCVSWSSRVCRLSHRVKVLLWVIGQCGKVIWLACRSSLYINVTVINLSLPLSFSLSTTIADTNGERSQRALHIPDVYHIHRFVFPQNILALHGSLSPLASKWNQMLHRRHNQTAERSGGTAAAAGAEAGAGAGRQA